MRWLMTPMTGETTMSDAKAKDGASLAGAKT